MPLLERTKEEKHRNLGHPNDEREGLQEGLKILRDGLIGPWEPSRDKKKEGSVRKERCYGFGRKVECSSTGYASGLIERNEQGKRVPAFFLLVKNCRKVGGTRLN